MTSSITIQKTKDRLYPNFEVTLLGNGLYKLRYWNMGSSNNEDVSYARTLLGARWKARRLFKKQDRYRKQFFKSAVFTTERKMTNA